MVKIRVPKHIQDAIRVCAYHNAIANEENKKIRAWLCGKGQEENDTINDVLIDSIELGNDPEFLIKYLKEYKIQ